MTARIKFLHNAILITCEFLKKEIQAHVNTWNMNFVGENCGGFFPFYYIFLGFFSQFFWLSLFCLICLAVVVRFLEIPFGVCGSATRTATAGCWIVQLWVAVCRCGVGGGRGRAHRLSAKRKVAWNPATFSNCFDATIHFGWIRFIVRGVGRSNLSLAVSIASCAQRGMQTAGGQPPLRLCSAGDVGGDSAEGTYGEIE